MFRFPALTPFVKKLLIGLVAFYIGQIILQNWVGVPVLSLLALSLGRIEVATVWQLVTHVLVIPSLANAAFAMLLSLVFLWWALAPFEERYGAARVAQLCVTAALGAGLSALLVSFVVPSRSGMMIAGPGPLTLAGIAAYVATIPPYAEVSWFGLFPMRARHIIWVLVGFSVVNFLASMNATDLGADLGAIGAGLGFVRWMQTPPKRKIFKGGGPKKPGKRPELRVVTDDDAPKRWLN